MAKVIGPLQSSEARGKFGGLIANTWRGTSYIKKFTSPAQPRTKRVLQIRAWTTRLVRQWQTLSATNQTLWKDYATAHPEIDWTGVSRRITGANWFVRCSLRLLDMTKSLVLTPPITAAPDPPELFLAADGILQSIITWTTPGGTDKTLDYWVLGPISLGIAPKIARAKHYKYCTGESGTDTYGAALPGRYWFWGRIIDEDNGLASPWVMDYADITAA